MDTCSYNLQARGFVQPVVRLLVRSLLHNCKESQILQDVLLVQTKGNEKYILEESVSGPWETARCSIVHRLSSPAPIMLTGTAWMCYSPLREVLTHRRHERHRQYTNRNTTYKRHKEPCARGSHPLTTVGTLLSHWLLLELGSLQNCRGLGAPRGQEAVRELCAEPVSDQRAGSHTARHVPSSAYGN